MVRTTVVSAPGKVLIAGGYLVLDPAYSGTVVSTSSRFYTVIQSQESLSKNTIRVRSPQFLDATWSYSVLFEPAVAVEASPEKYRTLAPSHSLRCSCFLTRVSSSKNKFVHLALQKTIALAVELRGAAQIQEALTQGLDIAIVGDNDFYSQRAKVLHISTLASSLSSFLFFDS